MKAEVGGQTALYGLVTGPFTLASHLRGTDIFLDSTDNPEYLSALLAYTLAVCKKISEMYIEAGMDVIAVVDPLVSQVSPRHFKRFLSGPFADLFTHIRDHGVCSSFFVCGDATKNLEVMCLTEPDCIAIDENIDMVRAKEVTDRHNIALSGNIPLTSRMLFGTQQDNMQYVVDLLDKVDHHNLIVSPGCDMPYDVPVENTIGAMRAVRDIEGTRKLLEGYQTKEDLTEVILPDYDHLPRPLIEVFTLDSETCAACSYMFGSAKRAAERYPGEVDLIEYKITRPENLTRVKKMGVKNLPSIYINGKLKFSSIIPNNRELVEEIENARKSTAN
jgi:uroporphyrinogen decarboxylase